MSVAMLKDVRYHGKYVVIFMVCRWVFCKTISCQVFVYNETCKVCVLFFRDDGSLSQLCCDCDCKGPIKRTQHVDTTSFNIVGCKMLDPFEHLVELDEMTVDLGQV